MGRNFLSPCKVPKCLSLASCMHDISQAEESWTRALSLKSCKSGSIAWGLQLLSVRIWCHSNFLPYVNICFCSLAAGVWEFTRFCPGVSFFFFKLFLFILLGAQSVFTFSPKIGLYSVKGCFLLFTFQVSFFISFFSPFLKLPIFNSQYSPSLQYY